MAKDKQLKVLWYSTLRKVPAELSGTDIEIVAVVAEHVNINGIEVLCSATPEVWGVFFSVYPRRTVLG